MTGVQTCALPIYSNVAPRSPYSASKASADLLSQAFSTTHSKNIIVTRCSNNYGPYQSVEKLVPKVISNVLKNEKIPLYGNGMNVREWIYVTDHVNAIFSIVENGISGFEVFNIGGNEEISINSLAHKVIEMCDSKSLIKYVPYQEAYPRGFEDMARRVPDVSKMHAYTRWNSKFGIEKIISDTRDYFLNLK